MQILNKTTNERQIIVTNQAIEDYLINTYGANFENFAQVPMEFENIEFLKFKNGEIIEDTERKYYEILENTRVRRNQLLAESDYLMMNDYPLSDELKEQVKTYRQALRDLPANITDVENIVFPDPPIQ